MASKTSSIISAVLAALLSVVAFAADSSKDMSHSGSGSTEFHTYNGRYAGRMPPYQIFMIVVGCVAVVLAGAIAISKRGKEDDYNPMDAQ